MNLKLKMPPACSTQLGATNNRFPGYPMRAGRKAWMMATVFRRRSRQCMTFR